MQDKKSAQHLIRMIRKDPGFSTQFFPYLPMNHDYASPLGRMITTSIPGDHYASKDLPLDDDFSNIGSLYQKDSFQDSLTRKWIKLLGLAMYFKNE